MRDQETTSGDHKGPTQVDGPDGPSDALAIFDDTKYNETQLASATNALWAKQDIQGWPVYNRETSKGQG